MVLDTRTMETDDEPLSFIHISAATENVIRFLKLDQKQHANADKDGAGNKRDQETLNQGKLAGLFKRDWLGKNRS